MPRHTFQLPSPVADDPPIIELSYERKTRRGTEKKVEEFVCVPFQPAGAMHWLTSESATQGAIGFIERCIADDDDALRFLTLCSDRNVMVRGEDLGEIVDWLVEEYSGRPTEKPSS